MCGHVYSDRRGYKYYKVQDIDSIFNKIIPHFDTYPLITSKQLNYLAFKQIVLMVRNKEHLNTDGRFKIEKLISLMNSKRPFEDKWMFLQNSKDIIINSNWLQAFINGEGTFYFYIGERIRPNGNINKIASPTLEISQNTHDILILSAIRNYFASGYLKPKFDITNKEEALKVRSVSRYIYTNAADIIKFIDKYPMFTNKEAEDYLKWKKLVELKEQNAHNTESGLNNMINIKQSMNSGKYKIK